MLEFNQGPPAHTDTTFSALRFRVARRIKKIRGKLHMSGHENGGVCKEKESVATEASPKGSSRRAFLGRVGGIAATVAAGALTNGASNAMAGSGQDVSFADSAVNGRARALKCFNNRVAAATAKLAVRIPNEVTNGDEQRFSNH